LGVTGFGATGVGFGGVGGVGGFGVGFAGVTTSVGSGSPGFFGFQWDLLTE
jgi:hypothetical protein